MFGKKEKKEKELRDKVDAWFNSLKYLQKLGIVLELFPKLNVTAVEFQGLNNLWRTAGSLEKKELIMETYEKGQKKERG
ncbi:hypothetical protein ES695_16230 [Candidatus Atribacteria bacterium 1244-E10-H5-B2]|nr:MAG: hypothetical protein ES695_16230 [Candidatus Atribacteria bacterium 1244-E10-H5-B2]